MYRYLPYKTDEKIEEMELSYICLHFRVKYVIILI